MFCVVLLIDIHASIFPPREALKSTTTAAAAATSRNAAIKTVPRAIDSIGYSRGLALCALDLQLQFPRAPLRARALLRRPASVYIC